MREAGTLNTEWSSVVVGRMHRYRISNAELADEVITDDGKGLSHAYLSTVLNGGKKFANPTSEQHVRLKIEAALRRIIARREAELGNTKEE